MRFGKSIQRKGCDRQDDFVLRFPGDSVPLHSAPKFYLDLFHALFRTLESHGTPQFLGFPACEPRSDHGHMRNNCS